MLKITLQRMHGTAILRCHGQIVRNEETRLLCLAVGLHEPGVILDLSHTTAIDQWGVRALISLQAAGIFLTLRNPNKQILRALRLRHVESIFEICESAPDAMLA
jgi:anti-anti-sigma regulatory factor